MAKLVTIQQGSNVNHNGKTGKAKPEFQAEETPLGRVKLPYAVAAVVVALVCLCTAVLHARGIGGDNELSGSQARLQARHKLDGIKPPSH